MKAKTKLKVVDEMKPIKVTEDIAHALSVMHSGDLGKFSVVNDSGQVRTAYIRGGTILKVEAV